MKPDDHDGKRPAVSENDMAVSRLRGKVDFLEEEMERLRDRLEDLADEPDPVATDQPTDDSTAKATD